MRAAALAALALTAYPEAAEVFGRHDCAMRGNRSAFVDPAWRPRIVGEAQAAFDREWRQQQRIAVATREPGTRAGALP